MLSLSMLDPVILYILASCMIILAFGMAVTTSHMRTIKEQAAEVRAASLVRQMVLLVKMEDIDFRLTEDGRARGLIARRGSGGLAMLAAMPMTARRPS